MTKLSAIAVSCLGGLCLLFGNAYAAPAAQTETLAQIHAKAGFQWPKDESRVNNNTCFACHKSYEELAKKTANLDPNPLSVKITFATLSVLHGVVKHAIFAGVYR